MWVGHGNLRFPPVCAVHTGEMQKGTQVTCGEVFMGVGFHSRLWDIECGACLRVLEGHEELVRCIRFDNKRIVSGAYDG